MKRMKGRDRLVAPPDVRLMDVMGMTDQVVEALRRVGIRTAAELVAAAEELHTRVQYGQRAVNTKSVRDAGAIRIREATFWAVDHPAAWIMYGMAAEALSKARARAEGGDA